MHSCPCWRVPVRASQRLRYPPRPAARRVHPPQVYCEEQLGQFVFVAPPGCATNLRLHCQRCDKATSSLAPRRGSSVAPWLLSQTRFAPGLRHPAAQPCAPRGYERARDLALYRFRKGSGSDGVPIMIRFDRWGGFRIAQDQSGLFPWVAGRRAPRNGSLVRCWHISAIRRCAATRRFSERSGTRWARVRAARPKYQEAGLRTLLVVIAGLDPAIHLLELAL